MNIFEIFSKMMFCFHVFVVVLFPGSLCGCDMCQQLLLLVPWSRSPGGHPHPAQHSVWELAQNVPEAHHPEWIWSRFSTWGSQCENLWTYHFNYYVWALTAAANHTFCYLVSRPLTTSNFSSFFLSLCITSLISLCRIRPRCSLRSTRS